jgi:hypothetical protein
MEREINYSSADWMLLEKKLLSFIDDEVTALKTPSPHDTTNFIRGKIAAYEEVLFLSKQ